MESLKYPIGRFVAVQGFDPEKRALCVEEIAQAPHLMEIAVTGLSDPQLETPYRPEGWTVRQVVHHLADSHINAYIRFRFALTEESPVIKPYEEARWAELADARSAPVEVSLRLLEMIHQRWVYLLKSLMPLDFARTFQHPEWGEITLDANLQLYAWHGKHHVAHINTLRRRKGW